MVDLEKNQENVEENKAVTSSEKTEEISIEKAIDSTKSTKGATSQDPQSVELGKIALEESSKVESTSTEAKLESLNSQNSDTKTILIVLGVIVGLFVLTFAGFKAYDHFTSAVVIDIDELHLQNLDGNLDEDEGYLYNGFSFVYADSLWWTEVMTVFGEDKTLLKIPLHFGPKDLVNVTSNGQVSSDFNVGSDLYIAIDPWVVDKYYSLALSELSFNVAKGVNRKPIGSCTMEDSACDDREIISCENNPNNYPVVELALDYEVESHIEMDGSCIKISGYDYGIVKAVDTLLYMWYGVI